MSRITTVCGDIAPEELGYTDMHEHVMFDGTDMGKMCIRDRCISAIRWLCWEGIIHIISARKKNGAIKKEPFGQRTSYGWFPCRRKRLSGRWRRWAAIILYSITG